MNIGKKMLLNGKFGNRLNFRFKKFDFGDKYCYTLINNNNIGFI